MSTPTTSTRGDAPPGRLLKYTSYVVRNPSLSEAEFHDHWRHHHARFPLDAFLKAGVVKYSQYHISASTRALIEPFNERRRQNPDAKLKFDTAPWDAVIQVWFPDVETWQRVMGMSIFGEAIFKDDAYMFDTSTGWSTLGWEEDMFVEGKVVGEGIGNGVEVCECKCGQCKSECKSAKA